MFEISVEDLQMIISGIRDSKIDNAEGAPLRAMVNIRIDAVVEELRDILENAETITWYTGYYPKVIIPELLAQNIQFIKKST